MLSLCLLGFVSGNTARSGIDIAERKLMFSVVLKYCSITPKPSKTFNRVQMTREKHKESRERVWCHFGLCPRYFQSRRRATNASIFIANGYASCVRPPVSRIGRTNLNLILLFHVLLTVLAVKAFFPRTCCLCQIFGFLLQCCCVHTKQATNSPLTQMQANAGAVLHWRQHKFFTWKA